jgi:dUTP pyrophosphatase
MQLTPIKIKRLSATARVPSYAHPDDAGMDLFADEDKILLPGAWATIGTGIAIQLPEGTEGQIRPRSGLAAQFGVTVLNSPGTIDSGYRGEVEVVLVNFGDEPFQVIAGSKIAQLVICCHSRAVITVVQSLDESERSTRGFGSTG